MNTSYPEKEKRRYYRHPIHSPLRLSAMPDGGSATTTADLSLGGLSFFWPKKIRKNEVLRLAIPVKETIYEVRAAVSYCLKDSKTGTYRTGVCFVDPESAFRARLAEEALEILNYRAGLARERGESVSEEEAAEEWVRRFAATFPA